MAYELKNYTTAPLSADDLAHRLAMLDRLANATAELEQAFENWATLPAAQKDTALRVTIRVVVALARLAINDFKTAGA